MVGEVTVFAFAALLAAATGLRPPRRHTATAPVVWDPGPGPHDGPLVYLARRRGTDEVKVGWTARTSRDRIGEWETGVAGPVDLEGIVLGDQGTERRIHRALSDSKIHNEWFRLPADDAWWRGVVEDAAG